MIRSIVATCGIVAVALLMLGVIMGTNFALAYMREQPQGPSAVARVAASGEYNGAGGSTWSAGGTVATTVNGQQLGEALASSVLTVTVGATPGPQHSIPLTLPSPAETP